MIKTWHERCEVYEGIVTHRMVMDKMLEEIDELRQALSQPVDNVYMSEERVHKTQKSIHEWVGLSDDEIMEGLSSFNEYGNLDGFSFAQWVENKLKEKNGG